MGNIDHIVLDGIRHNIVSGSSNVDPCYVYVPFRSTDYQGDCTILKCGSEVVLIDFGAVNDVDKVISFMVSRGLTKVTRCIITHYHYDHAGAYAEVIGSNQLNFTDCTFYLPQPIDASEVTGNADYIARETAVKNYIMSSGCTIVYPENDTVTDFGKYLSCRWLNADTDEWEANGYYTDFTDSYGEIGTSTNMNNFSLVTEFIHGANTIFLSGDLEKLSEGVVEPYITKTPSLYKMEHHGVNEVADSDYVAKINPEFTVVEGIGFVSHFQNNEMSKHILANRGNLYVQAYGKKDMAFVSDGCSVSCLEGTENIINDSVELMQEVTTDNIDSLKTTGTYRLNGIVISEINAGNALYGFMTVTTKGSFTIQDCVILNGWRFSRSYTTSSGVWSPWHGDALSSGTATLDTTNVTTATSNTITWNRVGNLVFVTGQIATTATPSGEWSTFAVASGLPTALFTQRTNMLAVNQSTTFTSSIAVIAANTGRLDINPRGVSCADKTFQINFIYYAK